MSRWSRILPNLLVLLTQAPRYKPEVNWSDKSWVHNFFRFYELIFWRKRGIRAEASTTVRLENGRKIIQVELYSFESVFAHLEMLIRNLFKVRWLNVRIESLQFAIPVNTAQVLIPVVSLAIALDIADTGASTVTSPLTWSHTSTGSNLLIAICPAAYSSLTTAFGAVSYAGAAATSAREDSETTAALKTRSGIFLKGGAASGANTVSVAFTGSSPNCAAAAISYSGAQSTSTADAVNGTTATTTGAKAFNVTTVADNCWVIGCVSHAAAATPAITSPTQTIRSNIANTASAVAGSQDSNAAKTPAGAVSVGWTLGGTAMYGAAISGASFAPASVAVASTTDTFLLMGV